VFYVSCLQGELYVLQFDNLRFMYGLYFPVKKLGLRIGSALQLSGSMGLLWIGGTKLSLK